MAIKIDMLRCFLTVAERGNLADAAEALGRTPSAVSMMLRQFEDHIGAPLFEAGRKSRLTRLGELIRVEAGRELTHFDSTIAAIEGLSRAEAGHVRLAVTPSVAQMLMPAILHRFAQDHPLVRINMRDTDSATIAHDLAAGRADIALASLGPQAGFERALLFSDRFGVVCPSDHPLAADWEALTWTDLVDIPFIANGLCHYINDPDFRPILDRATLNVSGTAALLSLVRAGMGVTLLPELTMQDAGADITFLPLVDASIRREVWMFTPTESGMTPATAALAQTIREQEIPLTH
ncbi:LysR family transcriptional regulator [Roseovarius sp.]|uniref:LysR family transcriptional regulator n=1 Tax=Roseovarius sp. TaxID=1486281 RepID=UPI003B590AB5